MSNNSEMLKKPTVVDLAGKKLKFKKLASVEILACVEDHILDSKREKISKTAEMLPEKERSAYIIESSMELPEGYKLEKEARGICRDMPDAVAYKLGWEALKDLNKIEYRDWVILFDEASKEECVAAYSAIMGKDPSPAAGKSKSKPGSTTGRQKR